MKALCYRSVVALCLRVIGHGIHGFIIYLAAIFSIGNAQAQVIPGPPVYVATASDYVTGANSFKSGGNTHWYVKSGSGADNYSEDVYERPTAQSYGYYNDVVAGESQTYATNDVDYFGNLDITFGSAGYDDNFAYFAIDMFSTDRVTADGTSTFEGMIYDYRIRISDSANGSGGYLLTSDRTLLINGSAYGLQSNFIYHDSDNDVGTDGNGYETVVASDGMLGNGTSVLFSRVNPNDDTLVEFALNYKALGLTTDFLKDLDYLVYEANKGLKDPANYLWNKEYTGSQAGSPNGGPGLLSEFGTQGLGNIYELDTLRGPVGIPEPSSAILVVLGSLVCFARRR